MPSGTKSSGRERRPSRQRAKTVIPNPFVALLPSVRRDVEARLRSFLDERLHVVQKRGPEVAAMASAVAELCLRDGKRLRAALVAVGLRAADARADLDPALEAGAALELLHTYLLIHDDWMDGDRVRRGGPAVHVMLARRLGSERRGQASAILAGDYALGLATEVLAKLEVPDARMKGLFTCFAEMQEDAILGQQLDIVAAGNGPEEAYALKTGSYTVRGPLRLGALIAGARAPTLRVLDRFAMPVGIAFQLRDDLLSAFGDPRDTGKPLGNDLVAGKRTPLVLHALKSVRGSDKKALERVLGKRGAGVAAIRRALAVIERTGARESVEARIDELARLGLSALGPPLTREGRDLLEGAVLALTARKR